MPSLLSVKDAAYNNSLPKAFLNWGLFDERFNYVSGGVTQILSITGAEQKKAIAASLPSTIPQNGYLYIYVSNESPQDVFFDNITIQHKKGPLVEETHYYPFGLTMAGISSKAFKSNYSENKYRFNKGSELQNKEFSDGSGLETYDTHFRQLDPQLGRWWQIDPKAKEAESPYSAMGNNPILRNDPLGDRDTIVAPIIIDQKTMPDVYKNHLNYIKKHPGEAKVISGLTVLMFHYEENKKKQQQNRKENKAANPVNNKDPKLQEDEVAPASTKEGGARGVRMAVPIEQNAAHGGQLGAAVTNFKMKDGDIFLTILVPENTGTEKQPAPTPVGSSVPEAILNALEKVVNRFLPKIPFLPDLSPVSQGQPAKVIL